MLCVAESSDLDETRSPQHKDEGEGEVDGDVVGEQRDRDDQRESDAALAINLRE